MTNKTHQDAQTTITKYASELLPLFADPWERWPIEGAAVEIANALYAKSDKWAKMGFPDVAQELAYVAEVIRSHAGLDNEPDEL